MDTPRETFDFPSARIRYTVLLDTHSLMVDEEDAARIRFAGRRGERFVTVTEIDRIAGKLDEIEIEPSKVRGVVAHLPMLPARHS